MRSSSHFSASAVPLWRFLTFTIRPDFFSPALFLFLIQLSRQGNRLIGAITNIGEPRHDERAWPALESAHSFRSLRKGGQIALKMSRHLPLKVTAEEPDARIRGPLRALQCNLGEVDWSSGSAVGGTDAICYLDSGRQISPAIWPVLNSSAPQRHPAT
jgi:hypothetical protein